VALLAGRVGPWVATPPEISPPTLNLPQATMTPPSITLSIQRPHTADQTGTADWIAIVGLAVAALALLTLILWMARALRRPAAPTAGPPVRNPVRSDLALAPVTRDVEVADDTDERTFDPRASANAIIAIWASLETAAARAGCPRRPASTPTEFLDSLENRFPPPEGEASGDHLLLGLYHRARFDTAALEPGAAVEADEAARRIRARFPAVVP
jgi:hypothetical protein